LQSAVPFWYSLECCDAVILGSGYCRRGTLRGANARGAAESDFDPVAGALVDAEESWRSAARAWPPVGSGGRWSFTIRTEGRRCTIAGWLSGSRRPRWARCSRGPQVL